MRIPLSAPDLSALESAYLDDAFASGWTSGTGPYVRRLEAALAKRVGRRHVIAVNSGTAALNVALRALDVGPGDEVIVPALTFAAPAAMVRTVGAIAVLCDVDPGTWTIDPERAAALVTRRSKAIIAVDVMGHPCDFDALLTVGLPVIEDAAQAHGAAYRNRAVGGFGVVSIFSFHANKTISTGEGGCVATDDLRIAERVRLLANHGMTADRPYLHTVVGHNFRMTNLAAALGAAQVERWDELVGRRRSVSAAYLRDLAGLPVAHRPVAAWAKYSCWLHPVVTPRRDEVVAHLRRNSIDARAIWPALSQLSLYRDGVRWPCPVAEELSATVAWLPTWSGTPLPPTATIAGAVREALSVAPAERRRGRMCESGS